MTNREKNIKELEKIKQELTEQMNGSAFDFSNEQDINYNSYLCDLFHEWADNNTSIYYYDQHKYYEEHPTECEDALLELYDGEFLAQKIKQEGLYNLICFAGAVGEYEAIYNELSQDEENIIKVLAINYLLEHDFALADKLARVGNYAELLEEVAELGADRLTDIRDNLYELAKRASKAYEQGKERTRAKAQALQVYELAQSWGEVAEQGEQLRKMAKRYGLIRELKNEGIL